MTGFDYFIFGGYFVVLSVIGYVSGRNQRASTEDYFLAGRTLPWYAVGGSYVASNISGEHFIGQVGAAFLFGAIVAMSDWGNVQAFSVLIWLFIPFLLASRAFTIPEFLERRFGNVLRQTFAIVTIIANIVAFLSAVLYAGGLALRGLFGWNLEVSIVFIAIVAGVWAVYGGLRAVVWTDLFTLAVLLMGGLCVTYFGLQHVSGPDGSLIDGLQVVIEKNRATFGEWKAAVETSMPEIVPGSQSYDRLSIIQPANHALSPWLYTVFGFLSISIWYNVMNQFIIQRVLAAKDAYNARMGIVFAGYLKLFMPLLTTLPGLILFAMYPELLNQDWGAAKQAADQGYIRLVTELVPVGIMGLVLAALFGAIQSTVNSVLNSTSTIFTIDVYKRMIRPNASDREEVRVGVITTIVVLIISIVLGVLIDRFKGQVFLYIQTLYAFFAAPFAAVFLLGLLWRRINNTGAVVAVFAGFSLGVLMKAYVAFAGLYAASALHPQRWYEHFANSLFAYLPSPPGWLFSFGNQALITWTFCAVLCVVISLLTPAQKNLDSSVVCDWNKMQLGHGLGTRWYNHVLFWWGLWVLCISSLIYLFTGVLS